LPTNNLSTPTDGKNELMMRFRSDIRGRMVLAINKGSVLYSIIRSDESVDGVKDSVQISSCMLSYVTTPESDRILKTGGEECDPVGDLPNL
jgi:hypothetical protein